jgi:hypothetical protein
VEAAVDDFRLVDFSRAVAVEPGGAPDGFFLAAPLPNPSTGRTRLRYGLASPGTAELRIFDVHGRAVRTLVAGWQDSGAYAADWDGRDDSGRRLANALYFVRLASGGRVDVQAVVLLH